MPAASYCQRNSNSQCMRMSYSIVNYNSIFLIVLCLVELLQLNWSPLYISMGLVLCFVTPKYESTMFEILILYVGVLESATKLLLLPLVWYFFLWIGIVHRVSSDHSNRAVNMMWVSYISMCQRMRETDDFGIAIVELWSTCVSVSLGHCWGFGWSGSHLQ